MMKKNRYFKLMLIASAVILLLSFSANASENIIEAEGINSAGNGILCYRSEASNDSTMLLHTGGQRIFSFNLTSSAVSELSVRYSNDNYGESETIELYLDESFIGSFIAEDTGSGGYGWNIFALNSIGYINIEKGEHTITLNVSGGDGYGIEIDYISLMNTEPPPLEIIIESEGVLSEGDGDLQYRSEASNSYTMWLHNNEQRTFSFSLPSPTAYELNVGYSNDNWGESETVELYLDGNFVGSFIAEDTGGGGYGWNNFVVSSIGYINIGNGEHTITLNVSGGDGYGIEIDYISLNR